MSRKSSSPYKCSFCSDRLEQLKFRGWRVVYLLLPMRDFRCPHCFTVFSKPVAWIGRWLPTVSIPEIEGVSKRVRRANRAASSTSETVLKRCLKFLAKLGKRVTKLEESFGDVCKKCFSFLSPQTWKKRRRNSDDSGRRRSGRHRSSSDNETSQTSNSSNDFPQSPS